MQSNEFWQLHSLMITPPQSQYMIHLSFMKDSSWGLAGSSSLVLTPDNYSRWFCNLYKWDEIWIVIFCLMLLFISMMILRFTNVLAYTSVLSCLVLFYFVLLLSSISLYKYTSFSLSILLLMDTRAISGLGALWIKLWIFTYKSMYGHRLSFLLDEYLPVCLPF